jgi:CLIP-associating protein 1/2
VLSLPETEESWDTIANVIIRLTELCKYGACNFPTELTVSIRPFSRPLNNAMCSERSRLSGAAMDLLCALAAGLGAESEPLLPLFFPTLLTLCTRTNKVIVTRARTCILAFIENTHLLAILPYLSEAAKDKSINLRITAANGVLACLNCFNPPDLEKEARARLIEDVIRATARDASADVRKISRKVFEAYKALLPGRVDKYVDRQISPERAESLCADSSLRSLP